MLRSKTNITGELFVSLFLILPHLICYANISESSPSLHFISVSLITKSVTPNHLLDFDISYYKFLLILAANNNQLSSSDITSSVTEKKTAVGLPSNGKRFASSSALMSEDSYSCVGENASSLSNGVQQQSLSTSLNNISLNVKPGSSKNVNAGRAISNAHYKPEKWMLPEPVEDRLTQLNLAIVSQLSVFVTSTGLRLFVYMQATPFLACL